MNSYKCEGEGKASGGWIGGRRGWVIGGDEAEKGSAKREKRGEKYIKRERERAREKGGGRKTLRERPKAKPRRRNSHVETTIHSAPHPPIQSARGTQWSKMRRN